MGGKSTSSFDTQTIEGIFATDPKTGDYINPEAAAIGSSMLSFLGVDSTGAVNPVSASEEFSGYVDNIRGFNTGDFYTGSDVSTGDIRNVFSNVSSPSSVNTTSDLSFSSDALQQAQSILSGETSGYTSSQEALIDKIVEEAVNAADQDSVLRGIGPASIDALTQQITYDLGEELVSLEGQNIDDLLAQAGIESEVFGTNVSEAQQNIANALTQRGQNVDVRGQTLGQQDSLANALLGAGNLAVSEQSAAAQSELEARQQESEFYQAQGNASVDLQKAQTEGLLNILAASQDSLIGGTTGKSTSII